MLMIIVSAAAAAHAFMFARWLIKNGNKPGALVTYLIAAACIALPVYRYIKAQ
ncbi:MAG: hypothetical protein N2491_12235 [Negativicutes bacterium]|nr:hypothetical protein [Negativicutes bacterium]